MDTISTPKHSSIFSELLIELAQRNSEKNIQTEKKPKSHSESNFLEWSEKERDDFFFNPLSRFSEN